MTILKTLKLTNLKVRCIVKCVTVKREFVVLLSNGEKKFRGGEEGGGGEEEVRRGKEGGGRGWKSKGCWTWRGEGEVVGG